MKNLFKITLALLLSASLFGCAASETTTIEATAEVTAEATVEPTVEATEDTTAIEAQEITMNVKIVNKDNDNEVVFEGDVTANTEGNLATFLENQSAFETTMSEGAYGLQIDEIGGLIADMTSGPYIVYDSENNQQCLDAGFCDGISSLMVEDGDAFVFTYTSTFD